MSDKELPPPPENTSTESFSTPQLSRQNTLVDPEIALPLKVEDEPETPARWYDIRHKITCLCTNWWLTEILCWCLAASCILTIAVVLSAWNGKPLPDSFPLGLKLNAYVSLLSAVAKIALAVPLEESLASQKYLYFATDKPKRPLLDFERFELAGRRPVGALTLIWRMNTRSIASLGAIIFLLSLGLDPFFQQLVSYPSRASNENRSRAPRVIEYESSNLMGGLEETEAISDEQAWRNVIPAFYKSNSSATPLNTFCPGDTCTWPAFDTLAICSECRDISSHLSFACLVEDGSWRQIRTLNATATNSTGGLSCGWYFNASSTQPMLMTGYSLSPDGGVLLSRHLNFHDPGENMLYWDGSLAAKDIPTPLLDFAAVTSPDIQAVYRNETPEALSCTLRWCVKRMSASFSEGVYTEREISIFTNDTIVPDPLECEKDTADWWYHQNVTLTPPTSTETFFVRNSTMLGARFALDLFVPNSIIQKDENATPTIHWPTLMNEPDTIIQPKINNLWLQKGMAPKLIDDFATQLANALRNTPSHASIVYGSGVFVTYIEVEWGFLSFPVIVLISTAVLLVVTVVQTTKKKVWKASDLTTLVHSLSQEARDQFRGAGSMQEVRAVARNMHVCLTSFENGRHLQIEQITSSKA